MPFAVTHVLVPIIVLELVRNNCRAASKFFSRRQVFLIGLGGLLTDLDLLLFRIAELLGQVTPSSDIGHRIIFHNIWVPMGFFGFFIFFYYLFPKLSKLKRVQKWKSFGKVFLVLFIGFLIHLFLDAVLTGRVMPFYSLNAYTINWNLVGLLAHATGIPQLTILVSMDALLLIFWLWHEEMQQHIKDYF